MRTRIKNIIKGGSAASVYSISGWVRSVRSSKGICFIVLNDGSTLDGIQIVAESLLPNFGDICRIGTGTALTVTGVLVASPASGQTWELAANSIGIIGAADDSYPLQKKRHTFEYLRSIAHLRPRSNTFGAVFRLRSKLAHVNRLWKLTHHRRPKLTRLRCSF